MSSFRIEKEKKYAGRTSNGSNRELWGSKWGFILACIGSAVGMGNIWLFPSRIANCGGAFLAAYLIFDILIGSPGVVGEMNSEHRAKEGPVGVFRQVCASQGRGDTGTLTGGIPMAGASTLAIDYSVVVDWIFEYVSNILTGKASSYGADVSDISGYEQVFGAAASPFDNNLWLIITLAVTSAIMVLGAASGIEKANKIMIPLLFLLFIGLAIYVYFQSGASDGYKYMFSINPEKLKDPMMWVYALGQLFFSLFLASNGTVIYGSYLSDGEGAVSSAWKVTLFDTLAAFLVVLVIVPAMAAVGSTAFGGGPGLMFIHLPNPFAAMPSGHIVMVVFFVAVLLTGPISLMNLSETPIATPQDNLHSSRVEATTVIGTIGAVVALCIQGIVSDWMDFVSIYICPLGAGLAGTMFAWIWGKRVVEDAVSLRRKQRIGGWYYPLYKHGSYILTMVVFILRIVNGGIG